MAASQPTYPTSYPNSQTTSNPHAYSYTHHQTPQPKYNRNLPFVRRLILALILLFVAITAVGWITWLILHPQEPVFHVDSLSVSNFNISDLQKNARYEVQLTVTNPNKKINLEFETFSVSVFYKRNPLSTGSVLRPFDVRKMNETAVKIELGSKPNENCQIRGKGTAIDMANMGRDWKQRKMSLNVEMVGLAEFKASDWLSSHRTVGVFCENLVVVFGSDDMSRMTGKLKSTGGNDYCSVSLL
ncbi:hypothetical protein CsSME_00046722 [Camellia sinensis var. sinensis]